MKTAIFLGKKPAELNGYRFDELAIAKIDKCKAWLEGDTRTFNTTSYAWFDRSKNAWTATTGASFKTKLEDGFIVPFDLAASTNLAPYPLTDLGVDGDEWSITLVAKVLVTGVIIALSKNSADNVEGALPFELGWTSTGRITIWANNNAIRLQSSEAQTASALTVGKKVIITATFSTKKGLSIWCNGLKVAEKTTDLSRLTVNRMSLSSTRKCGVGHMLAHTKDLNKDENIAEIGLLHQTLLDYYQIEKLN